MFCLWVAVVVIGPLPLPSTIFISDAACGVPWSPLGSRRVPLLCCCECCVCSVSGSSDSGVAGDADNSLDMSGVGSIGVDARINTVIASRLNV